MKGAGGGTIEHVDAKARRDDKIEGVADAPTGEHNGCTFDYMRYRGLSFGSRSQQCFTTRQNLFLSSPPDSPPMAYPGVARVIMASVV